MLGIFKQKKIVVGIYKVDEPTLFREEHGGPEWYKEVMVKPGIYDVYTYATEYDMKCGDMGHSLYADVFGTVIDIKKPPAKLEWFEAGEQDEEIGCDKKLLLSIHKYDIYEHVKKGNLFIDTNKLSKHSVSGTRYSWRRKQTVPQDYILYRWKNHDQY